MTEMHISSCWQFPRGGEMKVKRTLRIISLCIITSLMGAALPAFAAEKSIGVIMTGNIPYYHEIHKAFILRLESEGFFRASDVEIIVQSPAPEVMAWANAARKLATLAVNIIVSYGAPATLAVSSETSDIPIVFAGVYDPVNLGLNAKNITGMSSKVPVVTVIKNLQRITKISKLGVIYNKSEKDTVLQAKEVKNLETKLGFTGVFYNMKGRENVEISGVDALYLTTSCAAMICVDNFVGTARQLKIPTGTTIGGGENRGVVLTIAADPEEQGMTVAGMVHKILQGTKPSEIQVAQPKKVQMVINLKEAQDSGLKIPFDLLTTATNVIKK
jgi:putative ABC transport system substrate-binding protein